MAPRGGGRKFSKKGFYFFWPQNPPARMGLTPGFFLNLKLGPFWGGGEIAEKISFLFLNKKPKKWNKPQHMVPPPPRNFYLKNFLKETRKAKTLILGRNFVLFFCIVCKLAPPYFLNKNKWERKRFTDGGKKF